MKIKIYPSVASNCVFVPASKSVVHRALIASAMSNGKSEISNVDFNEDILATISGLKSLGAKIKIIDKSIFVEGLDLNKKIDNVKIDANESGSTLRFLIPLATHLSFESRFVGSKRLMERPLNVYKTIYKDQGLTFQDVNFKFIKGSLKAADYQIKGDISSQFITGLMFVLPLLENDSTIEIIKPFESKAYVDLTVSILKKYNINIVEDQNKYYIAGKQVYQAQDLIAEGDFSQAAFFAVLGAINNEVKIKNLNYNSFQGDKIILDFLKKLGVKVKVNESDITVFKSVLKSGSFDLANAPDLGPIMCVLGLFSSDYIELFNVARLRLKESDRLLAMKSQLEKLGAKVELRENSIKVYRLDKFLNKELEIDGCNDHRIVMAMAILATVLKKPMIIDGYKAVNKSYPNFFEDLKRLNIKIEVL